MALFLKRTGHILTRDGHPLIVSKTVVSLGVRHVYRGSFEDCRHLYGALAKNIQSNMG